MIKEADYIFIMVNNKGMMNYQETVKYLFASTPVFEKEGASAYKPGLDTMHKMDEYFGHPHTKYKTIHIAGTNGKGRARIPAIRN